MTAGSRHDTLDDIFGDLNWKTIVAMHMCFICAFSYLVLRLNKAKSLKDKAGEAEPASIEHTALFAEMTKSLPPEHVCKWEAKVLAWEADATKEDPYVVISLCELVSFCKCAS